MLKFNALFPVNPDATAESLISIANTWIIGSPHSHLCEEEIEKHHDVLEWEYTTDTETLEFIRGSTDNYEAVGIRYSKQETELRWITDIIGSKTTDEFIVSIQVSHDTTVLGDHIPEPKKPYVIKQLLEKIGGGDDKGLKVKDEPHFLKNSDIDLAANLINGVPDLGLPIIYVSSGRNNAPFVDAEKLAKWFSGMAHVVVEPNREFSFRLMHEVSNRNAYGGAVGIYWPNTAASKILLPSFSDYDAYRLEREVSNILRNGLNARRPPRKCTWGNLKELSAKRGIDKLRKKGSKELTTYIETFDSELKSKSEEIDEANKEISQLKSELQQANKFATTVIGDPVLLKGSEKELYLNEYKELLLLILEKAKVQSPINSRRHHILIDVLRANNVEKSIAEDRASSVKKILKGYKTMTPAIRRFLEELGFDITEDGKHYKAMYKGDHRYVVSFSKTSSDRRAGKNVASEINKLLF